MSSRAPGSRRGAAAGRHLARFDDICPTMNWRVWAEIEAILDRACVRPILAVVPDNQDPKLMCAPAEAGFWQRVRGWQARGWSIGLHGYQHRYENVDWGIMRLSRQSEFAGLPRAAQAEKLRRGLAVFEREGVRADCWVAPAHSFDWTTVELLGEMGLRIISDGLWPWPHTDRFGITWVPQQLWGELADRGPGVWTTCYHHNSWDARQLQAFREDLQRCALRMTSLDEVVPRFAGRRLTLSDRLAAGLDLVRRHRARPLMARVLSLRSVRAGAARSAEGAR